MAIILHLDTSGRNSSVCISDGENVLALEEYYDENYSHSEKLHLLIKSTVENSIKDLKNIDAVCVNKGPGSFTGLRIGSSSAKGICFALNKPLISIDSLKIISNGILQQKRISEDFILFPILDERNYYAYNAIYDHNLKELKKVDYINLKEYKFSENKNYIFFGDGIDVIKNIFDKPNNEYVKNFYSSAKYMIELSHKKFLNREFEDIENFEPLYIRNFVVNTSPKKKIF